MSVISAKVAGMLKGSFLGDAATMPLHWIYDQSALAAKVGGGPVLFHSPPSCPFYSYPSGELSPYGEEAVPLLKSIAEMGSFEPDAAAQEMFAHFQAYPSEGSKGFAGRLNHAPKMFVAAREAGQAWEDCAQDDFQANGLAKVPLIVARYVGHPELASQTEKMVGILQRNDRSVEGSLLAAKLLDRILRTDESPGEAIAGLFAFPEEAQLTVAQRNILHFVLSPQRVKEWAAFWAALEAVPLDPADGMRNQRIRLAALNAMFAHGDLETALQSIRLGEADMAALAAARAAPLAPMTSRPLSVAQAAAAVGLSCALPAALVVSLLIMREAASLEEALTLNCLAGGDNCSRAQVIGAAFGAATPAAVPSEWAEKVNPQVWGPIARHVDLIAAARA